MLSYLRREEKEMNAKGKKLIVPVVAIMMCAIALAGVAYALTTSSVNDSGNTTTGDEFTLEMYDSSAALVSGPIYVNEKVVDLYTVTNVTNAADTVTVKGEAIANGYQGTLKIYDTDATGSKNLTLTSTAKFSNDTDTMAISVADTTGSLSLTVTFSVFTDNARTVPYAGSVTFTDGVATLYYSVTVAVSGTGIIFANNTPHVDVGLVQTAMASMPFALYVAVNPTA